MDWQAFFATMIGLALLDGVLSSRQSTQNVGAAENGLVGLLQKFLDPATPAFGPSTPPNTTPPSTTGGGSSGQRRSGYSWNGNAG